ncbi:hypothetical protein R50073_51260 (plasmid) [Maricurvus nonylphenolicus]
MRKVQKPSDYKYSYNAPYCFRWWAETPKYHVSPNLNNPIKFQTNRKKLLPAWDGSNPNS